MNYKLIFLITMVSCYFSYGYHPPYEPYKNNDDLILDSIELNVYAEIYLHSNTLNLDDVLMMNRTEKDIYVFWNSFIFQNLINKSNINQKKTAYMNELIIYKKDSSVTPNYKDSISNSVPVFIKLPRYSEYQKRTQNKGQNIKLFFDDLNQYISIEDHRYIELKVTVNYIDSDDAKMLNEKFGINISEQAIIPLDTRISTFSRLEGTTGYVDCFNSTKIDKDLKEFNDILKSMIKKLTIYVHPDIFEFDPSRN